MSFEKAVMDEETELTVRSRLQNLEKVLNEKIGSYFSQKAQNETSQDAVSRLIAKSKESLKWQSGTDELQRDLNNFLLLVNEPLFFGEEEQEAFPIEKMKKDLHALLDLIASRTIFAGSSKKPKPKKKLHEAKGKDLKQEQDEFLKKQFEKQKNIKAKKETKVFHDGTIDNGDPDTPFSSFYDDFIEGDLVLTFQNMSFGRSWKTMAPDISIKEALRIFTNSLGKPSLLGILSLKELNKIKRVFYNGLLFYVFVFEEFKKNKKPTIIDFFLHLMELATTILSSNEYLVYGATSDQGWKGINDISLVSTVLKDNFLTLLFPICPKIGKKHVSKELLSCLIRKTLILKCNLVNIHTRQFLSGNKEKIFLVLKVSEGSLDTLASKAHFVKEMEIGFVDMSSLEPVDESGRPLKIKDYSFKSRKLDQELKKMAPKEQDELLRNLERSSFEFEAWAGSEKSLRQIAGVIRFWHPFVTKNYIKRKLGEVEKEMKLIKRLMRKENNVKWVQDVPKTKKIKDNLKAGRVECSVYALYLTHLVKYLHRIIQIISDKKNPDGAAYLKQNLSFVLHLVLMKAKGDANQVHNEYQVLNRYFLETIWDKLRIDPVGPSAHFNPNEEKQKWKSYQINEHGHRSIYTSADRIRMSNMILKEIFSSHLLSSLGFLLSYFALHDQYILRGNSKVAFFREFVSFEQQQLDVEVIKLFKELVDEADDTDFIKESIIDSSTFSPFSMFTLPIDLFRNYFGEKIAIYFTFLTFYSKSLVLPGLLGTVLFILDYYFLKNHHYFALKLIIILSGLLSIVYGAVFIEYWKRRQATFSVKYGQNSQNSVNDDRPKFKGKMRRSIGTDQFNTLHYPKTKRLFFFSLSFFVSLAIMSVVVSLVIAFLFSKDWLIEQGVPETWATYTPSVLNAVQINIFSAIYWESAIRNSDLENHETFGKHEEAFILKIFAFNFVNFFNSFLIISFLKKSINLSCVGLFEHVPDYLECYSELTIQVRVIFLVAFAKNIVEIFGPMLTVWVKEKEKEFHNHDYSSFKLINEDIEKQEALTPYDSSDEIDGTIFEYMELVIQFGFLTMFSVAFPVSFMLALFTNIFEIQVDKQKMLRFTRRPIPKLAHSIGSWQKVLEFISFCSIFTNSGIVCYTAASFYEDKMPVFGLTAIQTQERKLSLAFSFAVVAVFFLVCQYLLSFLIRDVPSKVKRILIRHEKIKKAVKTKTVPRNSRIAHSCKVFRLPSCVSLEEVLKPKEKRDLFAEELERDLRIQENEDESHQRQESELTIFKKPNYLEEPYPGDSSSNPPSILRITVDDGEEGPFLDESIKRGGKMDGSAIGKFEGDQSVEFMNEEEQEQF